MLNRKFSFVFAVLFDVLRCWLFFCRLILTIVLFIVSVMVNFTLVHGIVKFFELHLLENVQFALNLYTRFLVSCYRRGILKLF